MIGIVIMGITALVFSIILVNIDTESKEEKVTQLLPGYNCGACGYKGCADLASHIVQDPSLYKKCRVLKNENLEAMKKYLKQ